MKNKQILLLAASLIVTGCNGDSKSKNDANSAIDSNHKAVTPDQSKDNSGTNKDKNKQSINCITSGESKACAPSKLTVEAGSITKFDIVQNITSDTSLNWYTNADELGLKGASIETMKTMATFIAPPTSEDKDITITADLYNNRLKEPSVLTIPVHITGNNALTFNGPTSAIFNTDGKLHVSWTAATQANGTIATDVDYVATLSDVKPDGTITEVTNETTTSLSTSFDVELDHKYVVNVSVSSNTGVITNTKSMDITIPKAIPQYRDITDIPTGVKVDAENYPANDILRINGTLKTVIEKNGIKTLEPTQPYELYKQSAPLFFSLRMSGDLKAHQQPKPISLKAQPLKNGDKEPFEIEFSKDGGDYCVGGTVKGIETKICNAGTNIACNISGELAVIPSVVKTCEVNLNFDSKFNTPANFAFSKEFTLPVLSYSVEIPKFTSLISDKDWEKFKISVGLFPGAKVELKATDAEVTAGFATRAKFLSNLVYTPLLPTTVISSISLKNKSKAFNPLNGTDYVSFGVEDKVSNIGTSAELKIGAFPKIDFLGFGVSLDLAADLEYKKEVGLLNEWSLGALVPAHQTVNLRTLPITQRTTTLDGEITAKGIASATISTARASVKAPDKEFLEYPLYRHPSKIKMYVADQTMCEGTPKIFEGYNVFDPASKNMVFIDQMNTEEQGTLHVGDEYTSGNRFIDHYQFENFKVSGVSAKITNGKKADSKQKGDEKVQDNKVIISNTGSSVFINYNENSTLPQRKAVVQVSLLKKTGPRFLAKMFPVSFNYVMNLNDYGSQDDPNVRGINCWGPDRSGSDTATLDIQEALLEVED
ncbi:hypothetical protein I3271_06975 [Photobacterium leiognathi]|uniref:hypothetical protein n=1 Tax=Photobacterium leiognathi TaxID=553611 RepID=UPI001EDF524D|nr:hypothetical protein [Photobacterium leiognathi]MCG3884428.1 hypothetical protein [Photobacterium leiognathi]